LDDIKIAMAFIKALQTATLDNGLSNLSKDAKHRLRHSPQEVLTVSDQDQQASLDLFLALGNSS
jgi:hypothetical protein